MSINSSAPQEIFWPYPSPHYVRMEQNQFTKSTISIYQRFLDETADKIIKLLKQQISTDEWKDLQKTEILEKTNQIAVVFSEQSKKPPQIFTLTSNEAKRLFCEYQAHLKLVSHTPLPHKIFRRCSWLCCGC